MAVRVEAAQVRMLVLDVVTNQCGRSFNMIEIEHDMNNLEEVSLIMQWEQYAARMNQNCI